MTLYFVQSGLIISSFCSHIFPAFNIFNVISLFSSSECCRLPLLYPPFVTNYSGASCSICAFCKHLWQHSSSWVLSTTSKARLKNILASDRFTRIALDRGWRKDNTWSISYLSQYKHLFLAAQVITQIL